MPVITEATIPTDILQSVKNAARGLLPGEVKYTRQVLALGAATAYAVRAVEDSAMIVHALADNAVVSLPVAATCKGQQVTIQNVAAAGAAKVSISPAAADKVVGTVGAVSSGGVANKDWINTKATALKGDWTTLVSDGVDSWWILGGQGVWASEA